MKADFGIVGLAVMGQNLALNVESKGHAVAVYNRTAERTRKFMDQAAAGRRIIATYSLEEFVGALAQPRRILIQIAAGAPVDELLAQLFPLLSPGDIVMDGGNSHYSDTDRRAALAEKWGIFYLGVGISGGEHGALHGPSLMVGGHKQAYSQVEEIFKKIAAQGPDGPCCGYFGPGSAGHYVKMVHNGIEYAVMEIIAEAYDLMGRGLSLSAQEMATVLSEWNRGELSSYLMEITEKILCTFDPETKKPLVEMILDTAQQKGTGKWSTQSALDLGTFAPTIAASVFSRILSALKGERIAAAKALSGPDSSFAGDRDRFLQDLYWAVYIAVVAAYAQGFRQLLDAAREYGYGFELAEVARVWLSGCIIRSKLLIPIRKAFLAQPDLPFIFLAEPFRSAWEQHQGSLRRVVAEAHSVGIPIPAMDSAIDFLDGYRASRLPANLIQAQRDYFGAHTYERIDQPGRFHTEWEAEK